MNMSEKIQHEIAERVIRVLVAKFKDFPDQSVENRNAPFHKAFLAAFSNKINRESLDADFLISPSSWMHGLNTSLGQSFFENVANVLSDGQKMEWTSKKLGTLQITQAQKNVINKMITDMSNQEAAPDLLAENKELRDNMYGELVNALDISADVFFIENNRAVAIEMKTVQPNSGEFRSEKQKILEGKAALMREHPDKEVFFFMGFPFDRTVSEKSKDPCSYDKARFMSANINCTKFMHPDEVLLASELWDYLSGHKNTMQEILTIINDIATPEFENKFKLLQQYDLSTDMDVSSLLGQWHLYKELELFHNKGIIGSDISENRTISRFFNQKCFDAQGKYNIRRYTELSGLMKDILGKNSQ